MKPILACLFSLYFIGCKPAVEAPPPSPASVDAVKKILMGKSYHTINVGLLSPFKSDSTVNWMSAGEDTSKFFTDYRKERMAYTLTFINDTAFEGMDEGKAMKGTFKVDNEMHESQFDDEDSETSGIKLRLTLNDSGSINTSFADMRNVTYTTYVKGINDHQLMLALPREMNRRKVVALLQRN